MKKNVRLVLLLAMIAVMMVMTVVFASAVDVATEAELKAALAAGGEITLTEDITLSANVTVSKDVTINGGGKTLTMGSYKITVDAGTTTLSDLTMTGTSYILTPSKSGKIVINSGTYTGGVQMAGGASFGDYAYLEINGGTFYSVTGKGIVHANQRNNHITVNGGTFEHGENTYPLFRISDGTHNFIYINGGDFKAAGTGEMFLKNGCSVFAVKAQPGKPAPTFTHSGSGNVFNIANATGPFFFDGGVINHTGTGVAINVTAACVTTVFNATITTVGNSIVAGANTVYVGGNTVTSTTGVDYSGTAIVHANLGEKLFAIGENAYTWAEALTIVGNRGTITVTGAPNWPLFANVDKTFTLAGGEAAVPGMYIQSGNVTLSNVKFNGDIVVFADASVTMTNCTVESAKPVLTFGSLSVDGCTMVSGTGGIVIQAWGASDDTLSVTNSTLIGHTSGGCVYVYSKYEAPIIITDCNLYGYTGIRTSADGIATITATRVKYRPYARALTGDDSGTISGMVVRTTALTSGTTGPVINLIECDIDLTVGHTGEAQNSNAQIVALTNNAYSTINLINCTAVKNGTGYGFATNNDGTVYIEGGSYTYSGSSWMIYVSDGSANVVINGGTFVSTGTNALVELRNGKLTIENATMTQNTAASLVSLGATQSGALIISGSTLNSGETLTINVVGKHPVTITNSTLNSISIAEDYPNTVILTDVECPTITDPSSVAVISSTKVKIFEYNGTAYSWAEVLSLLQAGDTVKLTANVEFALDISTAPAFVLDANGFSIIQIEYGESSEITFKNLKVSASSGHTMIIPSGATVILGEGCEITNTNFGTMNEEGSASAAGGCAINNSGHLTINEGVTVNGTIYAGGTVVINGGTFRNGSYTHHRADKPLVFMNGVGHLTINGGDFKAAFTALQPDGEPNSLICTNDGASTVIINGGTFVTEGGYGCPAYLYSNDSVSITGGTFSTDSTETPALSIGTMHGRVVGAAEGTATELKGFTTIGGAYALEIGGGYSWNFTLSDVNLTAAKYAIRVIRTSAMADYNVIIKSGTYTVSGESALGVIFAGGANVIIEGGTFTANDSAVVLDMSNNDYVSNVTVKNGTFRSNGSGAVISIAQNSVTNKDKGTMGDLVIEGGAFSASSAHVLHHSSVKTTPSVDVTMTGGTFSSNYDAVVYVSASNPNTKIVLGGTLNLIGATADAAVIKTGAETISYKQNGQSKTYTYVAGAEIVLDGAVVLCNNATATAVINNQVEGSKAVVTFKAATLLSVANTGYFYVDAELATPIDDNTMTVKYGSKTYKAWIAAVADENAPTTSKGASVRAEVDSQGIRFTASVDAATVAALKQLGEEITYGMVIAPIDFVANAGSFTIEALQAYAESRGFGETPAKVYVDVKAVNSLTEAADGSVAFNAVIINVMKANYARDFAAIAYACVDGEYYYSAFNATDNVRSMAEIAAAALADVKDAADAENGYIHEVGGKYSKYTAEQCAALEKYVA